MTAKHPETIAPGVSAAKLARRLGCSHEHIRQQRVSGRLEGIRIGQRRYIFTEEAIAAFLERGKAEGRTVQTQQTHHDHR